MALHKDFPKSPHAILDPGIRWFPADEALRESSMEKLMPPLVAELRRKVKEFRDKADAAFARRGPYHPAYRQYLSDQHPPCLFRRRHSAFTG